MLHLDQKQPVPVFSYFKNLPVELRLDIWSYALPDSRIVYVQKWLTSGQDAEEDWADASRADGPLAPEPTHFMSPSSSDHIISLLQTCQRSRSVALANYTLLIPASSTWFSFSTDFLYLDFGLSPHVLSHSPKSFTASFPEPGYRNARIEYLRATFDEELAKRIKSLAIGTTSDIFNVHNIKFLDELCMVFSEVERIVLADQLHNLCSEVKEELVWLKNPREKNREWNAEDIEEEKVNSQRFRDLCLWKGTGHMVQEENVEIYGIEQELERLASQCRPTRPPTIMRSSITTSVLKKTLSRICGSEDNFDKLNGLDLNFLYSQPGGYSGPLNRDQLVEFLELALERTTTSCARKPGLGCSTDEGWHGVQYDVPEILAWLDKLGAGFEGGRLRRLRMGVGVGRMIFGVGVDFAFCWEAWIHGRL